MFKFLKRLVAPTPTPTPTPAPAPMAQRNRGAQNPAARPRGRDASLGVPVPVPEVVEGNEETDWALWEDSMAALDSQKQALAARASDYDKLTPSQYDEADPFASVRKRDR